MYHIGCATTKQLLTYFMFWPVIEHMDYVWVVDMNNLKIYVSFGSTILCLWKLSSRI